MEARLVMVTCANNEQALHLAEALVEEHLAGCVNIIPNLTSIYRWEGALQKGSEALLLMKTSLERVPELKQRVLELHSYQTPEFVTLCPDQVEPRYLAWLLGAVS
jgi:periplasmic divalent cation tolerance protein